MEKVPGDTHTQRDDPSTCLLVNGDISNLFLRHSRRGGAAPSGWERLASWVQSCSQLQSISLKGEVELIQQSKGDRCFSVFWNDDFKNK